MNPARSPTLWMRVHDIWVCHFLGGYPIVLVLKRNQKQNHHLLGGSARRKRNKKHLARDVPTISEPQKLVLAESAAFLSSLWRKRRGNTAASAAGLDAGIRTSATWPLLGFDNTTCRGGGQSYRPFGTWCRLVPQKNGPYFFDK